jgi:hypothetical protein
VKRVAAVLVGAGLVLTVVLSASAARRQTNANPVQAAESCIRAALRKEDLAAKYIKEGKLSDAAVGLKAIAPVFKDLTCAFEATRKAGALDDISVAESKAIRADIQDVREADGAAEDDIHRPFGPTKRNVPDALKRLEAADASKHKALAALEKATAPPPPPTTPSPATFTIALTHIFGAGPSSTNDCETVIVNETGSNVTPTGTLNLTGPGGFNMTNQLTFTPSGNSIFSAPSTFLFTAFGSYTETAKITVGGTTDPQTNTFTLDASNDDTTAGCSAP